MRPNDFVLNSDYLTLANVENLDKTIDVPTVTLDGSGYHTRNFDIPCKNIPQAIVRAYIHHSSWNSPTDQNLWGVGCSGNTRWKDNGNTTVELFTIIAKDDSTIRLTIELRGTPNATVSAHQIRLKLFRFRVPNLT